MNRSAEKLAAMQKLWSVYRSILAVRGLDIAERCTKWAERKRESLERLTAQKSLDELCRDGCKTLPLMIVMAIIQPLESFEKNWREFTGTTRAREQKIRTIKKAASELENLVGTIANVLVQDSRSSMNSDSRESLREEIINPGDNVLISLMNAGVRHPATTISDLRLYASVLDMIQSFENETNVTSSDMLVKYLMSAYVFRATGRFHDEEVSALIGNALGIIYDETAHRMWRKRNYERIDKTLTGIADMLTEFGVVATSAT